MKHLICFGIVLLLTAGCDKESGGVDSGTNAASSNSNSSSASSVVTAPVDYLGAIGKAQQSAEKTVDTTSIDKAIELFQVDNGRYPTDLNELVQKKYMPRIPEPPYGTKLNYDPASGKVSIVKQ